MSSVQGPTQPIVYSQQTATQFSPSGPTSFADLRRQAEAAANGRLAHAPLTTATGSNPMTVTVVTNPGTATGSGPVTVTLANSTGQQPMTGTRTTTTMSAPPTHLMGTQHLAGPQYVSAPPPLGVAPLGVAPLGLSPLRQAAMAGVSSGPTVLGDAQLSGATHFHAAPQYQFVTSNPVVTTNTGVQNQSSFRSNPLETTAAGGNVVATGSDGTILPTKEKPFSFTTVTYAKKKKGVAYQTELFKQEYIEQAMEGAVYPTTHGGQRFVKKQRGACGGFNENFTRTCFDTNGGFMGFVNYGCCDRPQTVPVAIDYSPEGQEVQNY